MARLSHPQSMDCSVFIILFFIDFGTRPFKQLTINKLPIPTNMSWTEMKMQKYDFFF